MLNNRVSRVISQPRFIRPYKWNIVQLLHFGAIRSQERLHLSSVPTLPTSSNKILFTAQAWIFSSIWQSCASVGQSQRMRIKQTLWIHSSVYILMKYEIHLDLSNKRSFRKRRKIESNKNTLGNTIQNIFKKIVIKFFFTSAADNTNIWCKGKKNCGKPYQYSNENIIHKK